MSTDPDPVSPWAGDSIPVPEPPQPNWDHLRPPSGPQPAAPPGSPGVGTPVPPFPPPILVGGTITPDSRQPTDSPTTRPSRRLVLACAATALTMLVGGSMWLANDTDDQSRDLADQADDVPIVTRVAAEPPPAVATPTTTNRLETPPPEPDDSAPGDPPAAIDRIELPPEVAAIQTPTEVIALNDQGVLYTVSLPGGAVRAVDLTDFGLDTELGVDTGSLVVSPSMSFLSQRSEEEVYLIGRSGPITVLDLGVTSGSSFVFPFGWVGRGDGSSAVVAVTFDDANQSETWFAVSDDGSVVDLPAQPSISFTLPVSPRGQYVLNDAGGAYRVELDGQVTRISSGKVLAATATHLMIRECDDARSCEVVVESVADGTRLAVEPSAGLLMSESYGVSLSPDGTAATARSWRISEIVSVDLGSGEQTAADVFDTSSTDAPSGWASDSSGFFALTSGSFSANGLSFFHRASGATVDFGAELGTITAIGVRHPDALLDS